ncbi:outer membrane beta-barrel protein [Mucilaginibacter robiniae]|uniref:Outer membrane beta-barrel protein n=1 Tax=Mucilaginibacter robiniae TaxID=2728022 RepID=A0A7L5DYW1_9SPHI|nr:outer membrane beta-barrel protein [Mucilaginibacter robiniae]QJD96185.1 outer membrane beta-barrel protein [Mucilaginibacter robiniae]
MKRFLLFSFTLICTVTCAFAQTPRSITGIVIDSTKQTLVGSTVKLSSEQSETANTIADANGRFTFQNVKGSNITLTVTSIGYQGIIKHYTLAADGKPANVGVIILKAESQQLNAVTIVGKANPIVIKEDTVQYNVASLNLRANATLEDALKKSAGIDVDPSTGAITAQGQSVTKVRINGKDYMGGDVTSLTRNLPADLAENMQIVDDYGDQANLTGIKTGEPTKVLNITIRKDKNYGYSLQTTVGGGSDLLPKSQSNNSQFLEPQKDQGRYQASLNLFKFKGDQQISILGNINNINQNTFNFGGGGGAGGNFGGGGGGGRGNGGRNGGGGGSSSTNANQNGITNARSLGGNFRDQWGKYVQVYGSYSFADNSTYTTSNTIQQNTGTGVNTTQHSVENDNTINHRFTFNAEIRPDTLNYLKITPNFSYAKTLTTSTEDVTQTSPIAARNLAYNVNSYANSSSPNANITALYNHRFKHFGRNFSLNLTAGTSKSDNTQNPIYLYTLGTPNNSTQYVPVTSRTNTASTSLSYIEPLSKVAFLEFNYAYNHSYTTSDKETNTFNDVAQAYFYNALYSNTYNFNFDTHRGGINFRVIKPKYNYTLGVGLQPAILSGHNSNATPIIINNQTVTPGDTRQTTVNFAPAARFVYNFSRSQNFTVFYNGNNNQPTFSQLQPVLDLSNASYALLGNPFLKPEFQNTISLRYNKFSFQTGDLIFTNLSFTQTSNKIVTDQIYVPTGGNLSTSSFYSNLTNKYLNTYRNVDGYYTGSGQVTYAKPWQNRRYTLYMRGTVSYTNNPSYIGRVDSVSLIETSQKNIAKNWQYTPDLRFRTDITDVIDAQVGVSYAINRTTNTISNFSNFRTLTLSANGKNYFWKNWTLSYDFYRYMYYGYQGEIKNPNILSGYVERRFLKNYAGTLRAGVFDIFNQNTGYTSTTSGTSITQSNVNRLGRYFLVSFTLRLQKFAGRSPFGGDRGERGGREGREGRGPGGFGVGPGGGPGGPSDY